MVDWCDGELGGVVMKFSRAWRLSGTYGSLGHCDMLRKYW